MHPQLHRMPSTTSGISRTESKSGMSEGVSASWSRVSTLAPVIPFRGVGYAGSGAARTRRGAARIAAKVVNEAPRNRRRVTAACILSSLKRSQEGWLRFYKSSSANVSATRWSLR